MKSDHTTRCDRCGAGDAISARAPWGELFMLCRKCFNDAVALFIDGYYMDLLEQIDLELEKCGREEVEGLVNRKCSILRGARRRFSKWLGVPGTADNRVRVVDTCDRCGTRLSRTYRVPVSDDTVFCCPGCMREG